MSTSDASSGGSLLDITYGALDLRGSNLIEAISRPAKGVDPCVWREVGEWLLLGARVGAERIFFVRDDPVFVFSSLPSQASEQQVMELYRRAASGRLAELLGADLVPIDQRFLTLGLRRAAEVEFHQ